MHIQDALNIIKRITYKPDWYLEVRRSDAYRELLVVRIKFFAQCSVTGNKEIQVCSQHLLDPEVIPTEDALLRRLSQFYLQAEHHECAEFFKLDGVPPFDPHRGLAR